MKAFPTVFAADAQPLSVAELGGHAAEAAQHLTTQGYEVRLGLTPAYAEQILTMAQEPNIREYCPKDSSERFAGREATEHWLSKGRAFFLLVKREDQSLVGYGWAGPAANAHVPAGEVTFALRIGEAGHGQGLAAPFSWLIVAATAKLYEAQKFWLETWTSNGAAVHIYHKLGFETVAEAPGHRPTAGGGQVADTRLYMQLPDASLST